MFNSIQQLTIIFVFSLLLIPTNHTKAAVFSYQVKTSKDKVLNLTRDKPLKFAKNKITFKKNDKVKVKLKNGKKVRGKISQINENSIIIIRKGKEVIVLIEDLKYIRFFDLDDYLIMIGAFLGTLLAVASILVPIAAIILATFILLIVYPVLRYIFTVEFAAIAFLPASIAGVVVFQDWFGTTSEKYKIGKKWMAKIE